MQEHSCWWMISIRQNTLGNLCPLKGSRWRRGKRIDTWDWTRYQVWMLLRGRGEGTSVFWGDWGPSTSAENRYWCCIRLWSLAHSSMLCAGKLTARRGTLEKLLSIVVKGHHPLNNTFTNRKSVFSNFCPAALTDLRNSDYIIYTLCILHYIICPLYNLAILLYI